MALNSARHRARQFALQGLYGWLLAGGDCAAIAGRLKSSPGYGHADEAYFLELLQGTTGSAGALRAQFEPAIDRPLAHAIKMHTIRVAGRGEPRATSHDLILTPFARSS